MAVRGSVAVSAAVFVFLAAPLAAAAAFDLPQGRIVERELDPGRDVVFTVPLVVNQAGFLYAKLLGTPGNAVNDGTRANGSVAEATGWRVSFAFVRGDGTRVNAGTVVDSRPSALVPYDAGESGAFEATVHVPADAASGGAHSRVYAAIAYRPRAGARDAGDASGATLDESRSVRLLLSSALSTPANGTRDSAGTSPVAGVGAIPPGGPPAPDRMQVLVVHTPPPTWFLVAALALLGATTAFAAIAAAALVALAAGRRRDAPPPREPGSRGTDAGERRE